MTKILQVHDRMKAILIQRKELASFSAFFFVGRGSKHDPESLPGLHHFLEHVRVDSLIENNPKDVDALKIEAWTDLLFTKYSAVGQHSQLDAGLKVLSSCNTSFSPESTQLEKVKKHIIQEIHQRNHEPWILLQRKWRKAVFNDPSLHHSALGPPEVIQNLEASDLETLMNIHQAEAPLFLVIIAKKLPTLKSLQTYFPKPRFQNTTVRHEKNITNLAEGHRAVSSRICIATGYLLKKSSTREELMAMILTAYLGQGWNSRLSRIWRGKNDQRSLAYQVNTTLHWFNHSGFIRFSSVLAHKNQEEYLHQIDTAINEVSTESLSEIQLQQSKQRVLARLAQLQDSPALLAEWWCNWMLEHHSGEQMDQANAFSTFISQVDTITASEVLLYAKKNLTPESKRTVTEYL